MEAELRGAGEMDTEGSEGDAAYEAGAYTRPLLSSTCADLSVNPPQPARKKCLR